MDLIRDVNQLMRFFKARNGNEMQAFEMWKVRRRSSSGGGGGTSKCVRWIMVSE